ncbi:MAG: hypothetical protein WC455_17725 [Dehalococcoidia bacterium]
MSEKIRMAEVSNCSAYSCPHRKDFRNEDTGGRASICWKMGRVITLEDFDTHPITFPRWCPLEIREKV